MRRAQQTAAEMDTIRRGLISIVTAHRPVTVRQVFYQAVAAGLIGKTEADYQRTVVLLGELRRAGVIPYGWIADNTRWMRKPVSYGDLTDAFDRIMKTYRRQLWADQDTYVEIWLEKDALAGVLDTVTTAWDVPLMVTRGYPSLR